VTTSRNRKLLRVAFGAVAAATLTAAAPAAAAPAAAAGVASHGGHGPAWHRPAPVRPGSTYLALGDSVTFGYREATNLPTPDYPDAASFVGYPEDVAADLDVHAVNASCPGETSGSFIDASAPSNGCENAPGGGHGYRDAYPLHVRYAGSQLAFAVHYLRRHHDVRLVSLMIGANDGFLCQETTADHCASELPAVLQRIGANVRTILGAVRGTGYRGQIVIVNYYSLNYADATQNAQSAALNQAMDTAAAPFHVRIADGFATFQRAALQSGGDSCKAGLLTQLTSGGCGVHPSVAGQQLLAGAVERVVAKR